MVFTSVFFLFLFLPSTKLFNWLFIKKLKLQNLVLMLSSLFFYYWGEKNHIVIMLTCTIINFTIGILIENSSQQKQRKFFLITSVTASLSILIYFKYFNFFLSSAAYFFNANVTQFVKIALPLGISFYTFHALSYVVDVYWRKIKAERSLINFICYISLFPQLVAGPIVRYSDIGHSFYHRYITRVGFRNGILRFSFGLGKKILIADVISNVADAIFVLHYDQLTFGLAWLGAISYALQIYFDFSGYSDMAIGLGLMFGFKYKENFRFPYSATSIQDFWRKWHISLSSWFRDYIYIPLGGNQRSQNRTYFNLIIVFGLCGLWHGANYTFILWGLFHGLFLILERTPWGVFIRALPSFAQHFYVLFIVTLGWVFFREEGLHNALYFINAMFSASGLNIDRVLIHINIIVILAYSIGLMLALGMNKYIRDYLTFYRNKSLIKIYRELSILMGLIVLLISVLSLSNNTYTPFLYFRF